MKTMEREKREKHQADTDRILKERAANLARKPEGQEPGEMLEVVEFHMAEEHYAIESAYVREVLPLHDITPLPGTPAFVLGIINVRGQILSVVDLKAFFELPQTGLRDTDRVIVLHNSDMEFGILAETITGSVRLAKNAIRPALPTMAGVREEFVLGITKERCVILDGKAILTHEHMIVDDQ